jgi:hypothetical protein
MRKQLSFCRRMQMTISLRRSSPLAEILIAECVWGRLRDRRHKSYSVWSSCRGVTRWHILSCIGKGQAEDGRRSRCSRIHSRRKRNYGCQGCYVLVFCQYAEKTMYEGRSCKKKSVILIGYLMESLVQSAFLWMTCIPAPLTPFMRAEEISTQESSANWSCCDATFRNCIRLFL